MESKEVTTLVTMDLSVAFDTVNYTANSALQPFCILALLAMPSPGLTPTSTHDSFM